MSGIYNNDLPNIRKFEHNSAPIYIYSINDLFHTLKQQSYNYYKLQDYGYWENCRIKHYQCDNCVNKRKIGYRCRPQTYSCYGNIIPAHITVDYTCKICNHAHNLLRRSSIPPKQPEYYVPIFRDLYCRKCIRKVDYMRWCVFMFSQKQRTTNQCCISISQWGDKIDLYIGAKNYNMYINSITGEIRFSDGTSINITDPHFVKFHRLDNR